MEDIKKTFTIQWVGPFASLDELRDYCQKGSKEEPEVCPSGLFNFYYFTGRNKQKWSRKIESYFGIHYKNDGIMNRVNNSHEHLSQVREDKDFHLWIGSFANIANQTPQNIEDVETIFIRAYKHFLSLNIRKTRKELTDLSESYCIINLWYKTNEDPWRRKPDSVKAIDDVLVCELDSMYPRILTSNLKARKV
jgi:hypothetical protein